MKRIVILSKIGLAIISTRIVVLFWHNARNIGSHFPSRVATIRTLEHGVESKLRGIIRYHHTVEGMVMITK
jgi:hypothetical protein